MVKLSHRYPTDSLRELMTYVSNNTDWIGDYDRLRSEGYPVGSGAVEKAVDIVRKQETEGAQRNELEESLRRRGRGAESAHIEQRLGQHVAYQQYRSMITHQSFDASPRLQSG